MERFHGIDRHKAYSTISVLNREGVEIEFHPCIKDLKAYLNSLGPEDTIVLEASTGSFWWADYIEAKGITCFVLNPYRFKIIKDSWNKTDKRDAHNRARALWVYRVTGEFGLPTLYKPSIAVRELRKLFTTHDQERYPGSLMLGFWWQGTARTYQQGIPQADKDDSDTNPCPGS